VSDITELPQLVTEMVEVSKEYLRDETIAPIKRLGAYSAKTIGAGVLFALGAFLLTVAAKRYISDISPDGELIQMGVRAGFAVVLIGIIGLGAKIVSK
jgi:hypothetical protein